MFETLHNSKDENLKLFDRKSNSKLKTVFASWQLLDKKLDLKLKTNCELKTYDCCTRFYSFYIYKHFLHTLTLLKPIWRNAFFPLIVTWLRIKLNQLGNEFIGEFLRGCTNATSGHQIKLSTSWVARIS